MGVIRKIDTGCGHLLWEYADTFPHHHLICQQCHTVQEIDNHVVECLSEHVRDHYGFEVNLDHLAIFGTCTACRAQGAATPRES
jgi:Fur family ferric uptake transcriptional regulator